MFRFALALAAVAAVSAQTTPSPWNEPMCVSSVKSMIAGDTISGMDDREVKPTDNVCVKAKEFTDNCGGKAALLSMTGHTSALFDDPATPEQLHEAELIIARAALNCPTLDVETCRGLAAQWPVCLNSHPLTLPRTPDHPCCEPHEAVMECRGYFFGDLEDALEDGYTAEEFQMWHMWSDSERDALVVDGIEVSDEVHEGCSRAKPEVCYAAIDAVNYCMEFNMIFGTDDYYGRCCELASIAGEFCKNQDISMWASTAYGTDRAMVLQKQIEVCSDDDGEENACERTIPYVRHMKIAEEHFLVAGYCMPQWPMCEYLGEISGKHMFKVDYFPFDTMVVTEPECAERYEAVGRRLSKTSKKSKSKNF